MKTIVYGIILVCLVLWVFMDHKNSIKHRNGKKSLNLSEGEWFDVLERAIEESWHVGLLYGFIFGIVATLFVQSFNF